MIVTVEMEDYISKVMDEIQAERYDAAINLCDKSAEISPNDFRSHLFKGVAYYQQADYEKAIECYEKSISVNPKNPITYIVRAEARWPLYLNQTDNSINIQMLVDDISKAIDLAEDPMFYFRRAGLYNYSGQYDKAIADCDKAISLDSQYKAAYYRRAIALALRDGNTAFKAEVEAILNQFPDDEWAKNSMELLSSEKPFKLDVTDW
jgi:tetratricopeptide (TPR) repeat protein